MPTQYAYFQKQFVLLSEARLPVMTHAFNYGTAVFEGIRGNWNADEGQLYLFRMREHFERFVKSCEILKIDLPYSLDEYCSLTLKLVEMSGYQEDMYIRPIGYKSGEVIGVKLHGIANDFLMFVAPLGNYIDFEVGARCGTVAWQQISDNMIPTLAKVTGKYVNSAFAKTEANENGYDEAIQLTAGGHVSEGSGENIFIVSRNTLITPPVSDDILVGITRDSVMTLAREELGVETIERSIVRSELYTADECFMTGTAAHVTPVIEVDHRKVSDGGLGPITGRLKDMYFAIIQGRNPKYLDWCTPGYARERVGA